MQYLIYTRVSTEMQDTETQLRLCLEYIKTKHGDKFSYKIFDEGSLTSQLPMKKRPKLQEMLAEVKSGMVVIVYELDRLARDVLEQVIIWRQIEALGATTYSLAEPNCCEMTVTIMGAVAQKFRKRLQEKTKDKLKTKKLNGERYSRFLPYGYAMHETKTVSIRVGNETIQKRGILIPVHEEQLILSKIQSFAGSGLSYQVIANELTQLGYFNREGKPFHKNTIYRILNRLDSHRPMDQPLVETEQAASLQSV